MSVLELLFKVTPTEGSPLEVAFYKVPRLAMDAIGEVRIDWGDGENEALDCTLTEKELFELVNGNRSEMLLTVKHLPLSSEPMRIRITTTSGFLPLAKLPSQTTALLSALPTLTLGKTDAKGRLLPSKRLPCLVAPGLDGKSALSRLPRTLLEANPQITIFDEAFLGAAIRTLDRSFFAPIERITSLKRTFAHTNLKVLVEGLLDKADEASVCHQSFEHCDSLKTIENPFNPKAIPFALSGFLKGDEVKPFNWIDEVRIKSMGCKIVSPTKNDPAFSFDWHALGSDETETVIFFYPIDLAHHCELFIEWGDGKRDLIDCNGLVSLTHAWKREDIYTVSIHIGMHSSVPPFKLGTRIVRLLSPLPRMHPRRINARGSLRGWAANARELESVASGFFKNNLDLTDLAQCFAGCTRLKNVPEDLFEGLNALECVDSMFAFCFALDAAPKAFYAHKRAHWMDYCAQDVSLHPKA